MFSYIIGEIKLIKENYIVLENNNIGYKIHMPQNSISKFSKNETHKIYTEYVVREDSVMLYGFVELEDLEMFLSLNQVSGIGPKASLAILSTLTTYETKLAILENDIKTLIKAPGIGKKSASRIILELTDKIDIEQIIHGKNNAEIDNIPKGNSKNYDIALEALTNLGYTNQDASKALSGIEINDELNLSDIIKQALKRM